VINGSRPPIWSIVATLLVVAFGVAALTVAQKIWWIVGIAAALLVVDLVIYLVLRRRRKRTDA
jgi:membrane protein DedA with SNARE-associated domain